MTNHELIERAAEAAYEAHHAEMFDIAWNDMPDWMKVRWRLAAQAVITSIQHPSELLHVMREMTMRDIEIAIEPDAASA